MDRATPTSDEHPEELEGLGDLRGRVEQVLEDALRDDAETLERSKEVLSDLIAELGERRSGRSPKDGAAALTEPMARWICALLRREILAHGGIGATAASTVELLRALEQTQSPELDIAEPHAGFFGDLGRPRGPPEAFRLLVEVAHDFRSPLTSILFLSETLRDGHSGPVNQVQRSQLGLIYSAAFGLAAIASDVMDMARGERDIVDLEPERYSIREVFAGVERLVQPIVEEKGLELRLTVPDLPNPTGHPLALGRVLLNLTTNALKYTDEGWVELAVRHHPPNRLEFSVSDTGPGISEDRRDDLFHPFKRPRAEDDTGTGLFSGSGVGLSIARGLVRAMGSDLEFRTSADEGTRFWFVLPATFSG